MLALHFASIVLLLYTILSPFFQHSTVPPLGLTNGGTVLTTLVSIGEHPVADFFREGEEFLLTESFSRMGFSPNLIIFRNCNVFFMFSLFSHFSFCLHGFHVVIFRSRRGRDEHPGGVLTDFFREGKNSAHGIILAHVSSSACRRRCG